jgi:hypothetical protein
LTAAVVDAVLGLRQGIKEAEAKNAAAAAAGQQDSSSNGNGVPAAASDAASKVAVQGSSADSS